MKFWHYGVFSYILRRTGRGAGGADCPPHVGQFEEPVGQSVGRKNEKKKKRRKKKEKKRKKKKKRKSKIEKMIKKGECDKFTKV